MRWIAFLLLVVGGLLCLAAALPAAEGHASLARPFDAASAGAATRALGAIGAALHAAALAGLLWRRVPPRAAALLVVSAAAAMLLLCALNPGPLVVAPLLVALLLLGGAVTGAWTAARAQMERVVGANARLHPLLAVPVPWTYVLVYLAGVGLQQIVPFPPPSGAARRFALWAGAALMLAGLVLAFSGLLLFRSARTTTIPGQRSARLVTSGPYRFTRNPMYVGLGLAYLGEAGLLAQLWPVLLLPLVFLYLRSVVIPLEEGRLRESFGEGYDRYRARVRRWL